MAPIAVPSDPPVYRFERTTPPVLRVEPGATISFSTGDRAYAGLDGPEIDAGRADFRRVNALVGPVFMHGAAPGDALGFTIERIEVGNRAFAVYVARWRSRLFGMRQSRVVEVPVEGGVALLPGGGRIEARPMVGCCGVAPGSGSLPSLSPTARTGGNMDLVELSPGATIWLPVEVAGGLFSLGDLHLRMGRGEPLGSGLECAGKVTGRILLAPGRAPSTPVIVNDRLIAFAGTGSDEAAAQRAAVGAAWTWLTTDRGVGEQDAIAICASLLDLDMGGPAGSNVVASFELTALRAAGVVAGGWPLVEPGSIELPQRATGGTGLG